MTRLSNSEWDQLLDLFHQSDFTQQEFAREHDLNIHTFRGRLYRNPSTNSQSNLSPFVQLQVKDFPSLNSPSLDLSLGRLQLRFSTLPDPHWIAQLVHYVREDQR